jgi:two-component system, sensor histidine kinase and response regulator
MKLKLNRNPELVAPPPAPVFSPLERTLLVVDDDAEVRYVLEHLFRPHYVVQSAASGQEALEQIAAGFIPQVIIADQRMPDMSGATFLAHSRAWVPQAVRLVLTGYSDLEDIVQSINQGFIYRFLSKPWNDAELLETVRACFERFRISQENQALTVALQQLEQVSRDKDEIMSIVAHDLRNPLQLIMGYAELLNTSSDLSELEKDNFIHLIYEGTKHMRTLLRNLLDSNTLDQGKLRVRPKEFDLANLIHDMVEDHADVVERKHQTIHFRYSDLLNIYSDPVIVRQVMDNLLSNAIKYSMPHTHIWINLLASEDLGLVWLEVQDQGLGIPEAELPKLFEKYSNLTPRPTAGETSTGLGLAICKKMVELLGGEIRCDSVVGQGTTFTVVLPLGYQEARGD